MEKHQIIPGGSNLVFIFSGVFGVVIKYGLHQTLSSQLEPPFREIPANMVGCFLVGFMSKASSSSSSSSGVFGSVTSLALWNQAMVSTALNGGWFFALCSLVAGLELAFMSYKIGLDIGLMLHDSLGPLAIDFESKHRKLALLTAASLLWLLVAALAVLDDGNGSRRKLWLACVVAPLGAWIRHKLVAICARSEDKISFPLGTLLVNLGAAAAAAGAAPLLLLDRTGPAALISLAVDPLKRGFADSMGSISTVMAEAHCFHSRDTTKLKAWRAYSYVLSTMLACGVLVVAIISTTDSAAVPTIDKFSRQKIFFV